MYMANLDVPGGSGHRGGFTINGLHFQISMFCGEIHGGSLNFLNIDILENEKCDLITVSQNMQLCIS